MPGLPPVAATTITLSNNDVSRSGTGTIQGFSDPENDRLYLLGVRDLVTGATVLPDVNGRFIYTNMTGSTVNYTIQFSTDLTYSITPGASASASNRHYFSAFEFSVGDNITMANVVAPVGTVAAPGVYFTVGTPGSNRPPAALAVTGSVGENGSPISIAPNVRDPEGFPTAPTYTIDTTGTLGSVILNGNAFTYNPNNRFESLGDGATAIDTFTYTVNDNGDGSGGAAQSSTATVSVTIQGDNDAPVATNPTIVVPFGTSLQDYIINYSDPEGFAGGTPTLTLESSAITIGATQVGAARTDGFTVRYAPGGVAPGFGQTFTDRFAYTISDGEFTDRGLVTFVIRDFRTTDENTDLSLQNLLLGNVTQSDTSATGSRVFQDSNTRGWTYSPGTAFDSLAVGETAFDTITYSFERFGQTTSGTEQILIRGVNDAPTAVNDVLTVPAFSPVLPYDASRNLLSNDTDPDTSDTLRIVSAGVPGSDGIVPIGSLILLQNVSGIRVRADGTYQYQPGRRGTDTITYTVADGSGATSTATLTITLADVPPDLPAQNPALVLRESDATGFLTFGTDLVDEAVGLSSVNGTPIQPGPDGTTLMLSGGPVTFTQIGGYTFRNNPTMDTLTASVVDTLSYEIFDSSGNLVTNPNGLTVTFIPENDAPTAGTVALTGANGPVAADRPVTRQEGRITGFSDVDAGDTLRLVRVDDILIQSQPGGVATFMRPYGQYTFYDDLTFAFRPNGTGLSTVREFIETFEFTVADGSNARVAQQTFFNVRFTNDPPVASNATFTTDEDTPIRITLPATDPENFQGGPPDSAPVWSVGRATFNTRLVNNNDGTVIVTPLPLLQTSRPDSPVFTDDFTYSVTDPGSGVTASGRITVNFTGVNDAPSGVDVRLSNPVEADRASSGFLLGFGDVDAGETALMRLTQVNTTNASPSNPSAPLVFDAGYGTYTFTPTYDVANGGFAYTFAPSDTGLSSPTCFTTTFTFGVTDPANATGTANTTVNATVTNDPPTAPNASVTTNEDTPIEITLPATDPENFLGGAPGSAIVWTVPATTNLGSSITNNNNGTVLLTPRQTLGANSPPASESFTYAVLDPGSGVTASGVISVTITGLNDAPTASNVRLSGGIASDRSSSGTIAGYDDVDAGDTLTLRQVDSQAVPSAGSVTVSKSYGDYVFNSDLSYTFTPNATGIGATASFADSFTFTVGDSQNATVTGTTSFNTSFTIDGPVTPDVTVTVAEGRNIEITPNVLDPENLIGLGTTAGPSFSFDVRTFNTIGTVDSFQPGTFFYAAVDRSSVPNQFDALGSGQTLTDVFTYTVTPRDSTIPSSTGRITVTVRGDDTPVATPDTFAVLSSRGLSRDLSRNILANDTDTEDGSVVLRFYSAAEASTSSPPVGDPLTTANGGAFTALESGEFTYIPASGFVGTDSVWYTVEDSVRQRATARVDFNVAPTADAITPTASTIFEDPGNGRGPPRTGFATLGDDAGGQIYLSSFAGTAIPRDGSAEVAVSGGLLTVFSDFTYLFFPNSQILTTADPILQTVSFATTNAGTGITTQGTGLQLTFQPTNSVPAIAGPDIEIPFGSTAPQTITATVYDPEQYTEKPTPIFSSSQPTFGTVQSNGDGTFTYTPDGTQPNVPVGRFISDIFFIGVNDNETIGGIGPLDNSIPIRVTYVNRDVVNGTDGDDTLTGTGGQDEITPGLGADSVQARDGDDLILLANGDGTYTPFSAYNTDLRVSDGRAIEVRVTGRLLYHDVIDGGPGDFDTIRGTDLPAGDVLFAYSSLPGVSGTDVTQLRIRNVERFELGAGDDILDLTPPSRPGFTAYSVDVSADGGTGSDHLWGGSGNDTLEGGPGRDYLSGGPGNDELAGFIAGLGGDGVTDYFLFGDHPNAGTDRVLDFEPGVDRLVFIGFGTTRRADLTEVYNPEFNQTRITARGDNTVDVVLPDINSPLQLTDSDFIFLA